MTQEQLSALLENITGNFHTTTPGQDDRLKLAQQRIANSLVQYDDTGSTRLFANSDFYGRENISSKRITSIADIAKNTIENPSDTDLRVFVRAVPVVNSQIAASTPQWAIGAKPVDSLGPFINDEGRYVWVDIYKTVKLTTLFLGTQPVLLFNASTLRMRVPVPDNNNFSIAAGTVWINASLLSPGAPINRFVGVKAKSGTLKLSLPTTTVNGNITLNPATIIDMDLKLEQHTDDGAASSSVYGKDARDCKYLLPETLQFSWNGPSKKVTALSIGNASAEMYGQAYNFSYNRNEIPAISYNSLLKVVAFKWKSDRDEFTINKNSSSFISLSESCPIINSYWVLPAAELDVVKPVQAEGNGGVFFECGKGLRGSWSNLENGDARLIKPFIIGLPGSLFIIDFVADISAASQHFELWKDSKDPYSSSADLLFYKEVPVLINISSATNQEFITTQCNSEFKIDRPVKVNGEPFGIHSKASALMLSANDVSRFIYLYDDNIIEDNTTKNGAEQAAVAIALENALFTVSQVNTCMLFGECSDDWKKITRANLFLLFNLFRYLPTLPDPYVGRLRMWERLFGQGGKRLNNEDTNKLICAIKYSRDNEEGDKISTNFYFGTVPPVDLELPKNNEDEGNISSDQPKRHQGVKDRFSGRGRKGTMNTRLLNTEREFAGNRRTELIRPLSKIGSIAGSVKLNIDYIEKRATANNNLLESLNLKPGKTKTNPTDNPSLNTAPTGNQLQRSIKEKEGDLGQVWDDVILDGRLSAEPFALLDISSNANQMGISISSEMIIVKTGNVIRENDNNSSIASAYSWPFVVEGMQVKTKGQMVRSFTLPLIAWEPVTNLTPPDRSDPPASNKLPMDPEPGYLFYEDDGGPTRMWNNNQKLVALAPVPVIDSIIKDFKFNPQNYTISAFTLPFGIKAISYLSRNFVENTKPDINNLRPTFRRNADGTDQFEGGIQLSLTSGDFGKHFPLPAENDDHMFPGYVVQQNNLLDMVGNKSGASNLGHRVTEIFNNEFLIGALSNSNLLKDSRGVPVTRMDVTGYGANIFSNWLSPTAAMAQTSQARFDVMMGRTAHEVIQVKSILYPWGIRVVRTITVFRSGSGYIYRTDSGWKAESDGKFDFSYRYLLEGRDPLSTHLTDADFMTKDETFEFHPGIIKGLFNVRNIKDAPDVKEYTSFNEIKKDDLYVNGIKGQEVIADEDKNEPVKCGGVYFDADIEIENVVQGHTNNRVVSKKILGYVQVAPAGKPLTPKQLKELLALQNNSIGGDVDCIININNSDQQMRLTRFDVNNSPDKNNNPVFTVAARGTVALPKAGSWSVVEHNAGSGVVTPLPEGITVPLIRTGKWVKDKVINPSVVTSKLLRIAHPLEILRDSSDSTINFGYLQTTATQKALFLTPSYGNKVKKLLSKTPPVFADAYRLMEGNSIFPNIGNAITNFGKAMPMLNGKDNAGNDVTAFVSNALTDGGTQVLELMEVQAKKAGEAIVDQGMKLLQKGADGLVDKALKFDIPPFEVPLVDTEALRIYIEYATKKKPETSGGSFTDVVDGKLNFDVDSFSTELGEQWKSRVNNLAMVVDLGDMKRLMTIKGNFDANKNKETGYEGGDNSGKNGFPTPEIEFSEALQPVIDILEVLAQLSQGNYGEAMKKGLKVAMSNSGEIWEYKFEASKDIPLVRFPPTDELYNSAQTPLKLEASLGLGVYFNAALKVTTDPKQLLPTAGAFLTFHGGLSVMCVSVGAGSVYAIGNVDVKIACDTMVGPNLTLAFGFGVSIVVSLPVVGHASVTYMMGITMYADKTKVIITAMMLFKGNAELLGGLVCVTITIEAKGIIERSGGQTQASAQVTFALDISIFLIIDISFSKTWGEDRQIA